MEPLREKKKRETRERISDVATALFFARGFDAVTVEEVARAAKVSKMTVFNYFARKEELLLDREDDLKLLPFRLAIRTRAPGQTPVDALRARLHELADKATAGLARLTAGVIVLTLRTARQEAIRLLTRGASLKKANAAFLALMEQGLAAAEKLAA